MARFEKEKESQVSVTVTIQEQMCEVDVTPLQLHEQHKTKAVGVGAAGEASAAPLFQPPKFGHAHLLKFTWAVYCLTPALCAQPFALIFANEDSDT